MDFTAVHLRCPNPVFVTLFQIVNCASQREEQLVAPAAGLFFFHAEVRRVEDPTRPELWRCTSQLPGKPVARVKEELSFVYYGSLFQTFQATHPGRLKEA